MYHLGTEKHDNFPCILTICRRHQNSCVMGQPFVMLMRNPSPELNVLQGPSWAIAARETFSLDVTVSTRTVIAIPTFLISFRVKMTGCGHESLCVDY